eukprot:15452306-Alexandrium_andersonii.AAC.1
MSASQQSHINEQRTNFLTETSILTFHCGQKHPPPPAERCPPFSLELLPYKTDVSAASRWETHERTPGHKRGFR